MTVINAVIKGKQPVIDTLNVTPTTSAQQITATGGTDGYSPVNVSAVTSSIDANIVAGNIKKDVQILGVTGSYEGTTPTGTVNITSNGTHNVSSYEYAEVLVPTTAPAYYIEKTKDANGVAQNSSNLIDLSTFTDVDSYVLAYTYYANTGISGTVDFGSLTTVSGTNGCGNMFSGCTGITTVDLSSLTTISGNNGCYNMFVNCTGITSIDLGSLTTISGNNGCYGMFNGCAGLTGAVDLSSLTTIFGSAGCNSMFKGCTGITSIDLSSLTILSGQNACANMFYGCTGLTGAVDLSSLTTLSSQQACGNMFSGCTGITSVDISHLCKIGNTGGQLMKMFENCTSLTSLSFPNLAYTATNFNGAFSNTLFGVTGCTVHFPAEWQTKMSSWSHITNGMGGTNTTVLFDLPNVTTLDLSNITSIERGYNAFGSNGYFPNITSVDLSSLTTISGEEACFSMFAGCPGLTSVNLSALTTVSGSEACSSMFQSCTGLASIDLSSLTTLSGLYACSYMFFGCTSLTTVYIGGTTAINFGTYTNQFYHMFDSCTQNIDVYAPAANKTQIEAFSDYPTFGGTGTVTWHWRS